MIDCHVVEIKIYRFKIYRFIITVDIIQKSVRDAANLTNKQCYLQFEIVFNPFIKFPIFLSTHQ